MQSPVLRRVDLRVSMKKYKHFKMFGTELKKDKNGVFEDPCAGDSGGPLMYRDRSSHRWTLIGQIHRKALFNELLKNLFVCAGCSCQDKLFLKL